MNIAEKYIRLLEKWVAYAVNDIYICPDRPELAYYGDGTNGWGCQTNLKAFAAFAILATSDHLNETNT